ncbi:DUF975 family protein [Luoshenia tenuis]|jgi:uncharacterized membrane protein|uniref:DUF975 family protein n=1 Tax=Luoshenia tenuis TaxID=2763654 RepID=UPI003D90EF33
MLPRAQIKRLAKERFTARYGRTLGGVLAAGALIYFASPFIVISPVLMVGLSLFALATYTGREDCQVGMIFDGFEHFGRNLGSMLLQWLFLFCAYLAGLLAFMLVGFIIAIIVGVSTTVMGGATLANLLLLLFVPLAIAVIVLMLVVYYILSMTRFILAESHQIKAFDALKLSARITKGHRADIFVFDLSFLGWMLLGVLTLGILNILYVIPYMTTAQAGLYTELKREAIAMYKVKEEEFN